MEPLPPGFRVPRVQGVGKRDYAWIICLKDGAIYVEVRWREDGGRCKALTTLRANVNFKAIVKEERTRALSAEEEDD